MLYFVSETGILKTTQIFWRASPEEHCQDGQQTLDNDEDQDDDAVAVGPGVGFRAGCDQSEEAEEENNRTLVGVVGSDEKLSYEIDILVYTCHDGTNCNIAQLISLPDIEVLQSIDDGPAQKATACNDQPDESHWTGGSSTHPATSRRMTGGKEEVSE